MKTYILYNSVNANSVKNAEICLKSFEKFSSWQPELFDGCTPAALDAFQSKYKLKDDRGRFPPTHAYFKSKKSCFYSHFTLWLACIELNQPVTIVEHDTYCDGDLPDSFSFTGAVQFTAESIFKHLPQYAKLVNIYKNLLPGLYSFDTLPPTGGWGHCMAGNTGYGITPAAAEILVNDCFENGWQQNDVLMSTKLCVVEFVVPSLIVYDPLREIKSSSQPNF